MKSRYPGVGIVSMVAVFAMASVCGAAVNSHLTGGLEYRFGAGGADVDDAPGVYATYEIELPEPVSVVFGVNYFGGDYELGAMSGSYDTIGVDVLMVVAWTKGVWRPYLGLGGAHYFNSFSNINFPDKLGMVYEAGTHMEVTDRLKGQLALRYMTLRPDHLDARIGEIIMDATVLRAGLVFDF